MLSTLAFLCSLVDVVLIGSATLEAIDRWILRDLWFPEWEPEEVADKGGLE